MPPRTRHNGTSPARRGRRRGPGGARGAGRVRCGMQLCACHTYIATQLCTCLPRVMVIASIFSFSHLLHALRLCEADRATLAGGSPALVVALVSFPTPSSRIYLSSGRQLPTFG